jgi:hypothetical protein
MALNVEEPDDLITGAQSGVALDDALQIPLEGIPALLDEGRRQIARDATGREDLVLETKLR